MYSIFPGRYKSDIDIENENKNYIIDIGDKILSTNIYTGNFRKIGKYWDLGIVIPYVIGYLGSWSNYNYNLKEDFEIPKRIWKELNISCIK